MSREIVPGTGGHGICNGHGALAVGEASLAFELRGIRGARGVTR